MNASAALASLRSCVAGVVANIVGAGQIPKALTTLLVATIGDPERPLLAAILILWCLDGFLGFWRAVLDRRICSRKMFYGLIKLLVYLVILAASWQIRQVVPVIGMLVASIIDSYVCLTEAASVLRNAAGLGDSCGFKLPGLQRIAQYLESEAGDATRRLPVIEMGQAGHEAPGAP